jgi:anti-anti-sigma regulatory factor
MNQSSTDNHKRAELRLHTQYAVTRSLAESDRLGSLDTERMQRATESAMREVMRTNAHSCIIDITGACIVDSHAVANLGNLVSALKLIGAEAIVTGVTAHAAHTLVGLGVDFTGMKTRRTLAEALAGIIKSQPQSKGDGYSSNGFTEELR